MPGGEQSRAAVAIRQHAFADMGEAVGKFLLAEKLRKSLCRSSKDKESCSSVNKKKKKKSYQLTSLFVGGYSN